MMTFLQRLKVVATTRERGKPENLCTVRREDLAALIHHFERLDSEARVRQESILAQLKEQEDIARLIPLK